MFAVQVAYLAITSWLDERAEKEDRKKFDAAAAARCMKFVRQCFPCFFQEAPVMLLRPHPLPSPNPCSVAEFHCKALHAVRCIIKQLHTAEKRPTACSLLVQGHYEGPGKGRETEGARAAKVCCNQQDGRRQGLLMKQCVRVGEGRELENGRQRHFDSMYRCRRNSYRHSQRPAVDDTDVAEDVNT